MCESKNYTNWCFTWFYNILLEPSLNAITIFLQAETVNHRSRKMQEIYKHDELITLELSNQQLGPNLEIACKINQNKVQSFDRNIKEEDRLEPFIPSTETDPAF